MGVVHWRSCQILFTTTKAIIPLIRLLLYQLLTFTHDAVPCIFICGESPLTVAASTWYSSRRVAWEEKS
jgi:hypothetical protein